MALAFCICQACGDTRLEDRLAGRWQCQADNQSAIIVIDASNKTIRLPDLAGGIDNGHYSVEAASGNTLSGSVNFSWQSGLQSSFMYELEFNASGGFTAKGSDAGNRPIILTCKPVK